MGKKHLFFLFFFFLSPILMARSEPVTAINLRIGFVTSPINFLDPAAVRDATSYILLSNMTRNLVSIDARAQIQADLAESWSIGDNYKLFRFVLKKNEKWSNGQIITCEDIVSSYLRQKGFHHAIHYDFSKIKDVLCENGELVIFLNSSDSDFLSRLVTPEFSVLFDAKKSKKIGDLDWSVTSGAYFFDASNENKIQMKFNPHFPVLNDRSIQNIEIFFGDVQQQAQNLIENQLDVIFPWVGVGSDLHEKMILQPQLTFSDIRAGFTYWISINAGTKELSDPQMRHWIQSLFYFSPLDFSSLKPEWSPAKQLFLPDGSGRLSDDEIKTFSKNLSHMLPVKKIKNLSFLARHDLPFLSQLVDVLKKNGITVDLTTYSTQHEYSDLIDRYNFHLIQINNDFSSPELSDSLFVTLNPARPLIFAGGKQEYLFSQAKKSAKEPSYEKRQSIYRKISSELLHQAFIVPIAYKNTVIYYQRRVDISPWLELSHNIRFWEARFN